MWALTETAPWATAILALGKDVENRDWAPPSELIGKRFAVHQGKTLDDDALDFIQDMCDGRPASEEVVLGAFLGTVILRGYVRGANGKVVEHPGLTADETRAALASEWRNPEAKCLWVLREPRALPEPIPCRGMQKLWRVPPEVEVRINAALGAPGANT